MTPPPQHAWLPAPRPIDEKFSTWLDLFRWLAALAVCSAHVRALVMADYTPAAGPGWLARPLYFVTGFGNEAVIIFFVLSGYLVGGEVLRGLHRGDFDGRIFAVRRMARLYAVYLAALLLGGLWDNLGAHFFNDRELYTSAWLSTMIFEPITDQLGLSTLLGNLAFTQTVLVPTFGSNTPLWSLANEAWYYLLFPLIAWPLFSRGPGRGRLACLLVGAAAAWFISGRMLLYFVVWLLGLTPHFLRRPLLRPVWLPALGVVALLVLNRAHLLDFLPIFGIHLLLAAGFMLWLNSLEHRSPPVPGGPAGLHRFLAGFSYTLYLTHWPLALLLSAGLDQQFGIGSRMPFGPVAAGLWVLLLVVAYFYSWTVAQLTERHTPKLRRWLLGRTGIAREKS